MLRAGRRGCPFFRKAPVSGLPFPVPAGVPFRWFRETWGQRGPPHHPQGHGAGRGGKAVQAQEARGQGTFGRRSGGCGLPLRRRRCHLTVPSGFRELLVNLHPLKISFPLGFTRIFGLEAVGDLFLGGIVIQQVRGNPNPNVINSPAPHDIGG